jgi:predicted sulfurtransferase
MSEKIILFYKYVDIEDVHQVQRDQHKLCTELELKGRVILAHEGINATLGGKAESLERYKAAMSATTLFSGIDFKESPGLAADFPKLSIKIKPEIVKLGIPAQELKAKDGGVHLTPAQAHELLEKKPENLLVLDCRNTYESKVGHFRGALKPEVNNFRDFPAYVDTNLEMLKDKEILMYCTGGIRCERASAYMKQKGIQNVSQILGGIHRYVEEFPDGHFRGKNYVFDDRLAITVNNDIVANCDLCQTTCDEQTNCANTSCNKQYIACQTCLAEYVHTCSQSCKTLVAEKKVATREIYRTRRM